MTTSLETMVNTPLPYSLVHDQLLASQRALNPTLTEPIINRRALLILSRPVSSVLIVEHEMLVLEFFGIFWTHGPLGSTGFFPTEDDATRYLMELMCAFE